MTKQQTTVRSDLAKRDARDVESERCESTYRIPRNLPHAGETVRCSRPRSGHRVHEFGGWLQW